MAKCGSPKTGLTLVWTANYPNFLTNSFRHTLYYPNLAIEPPRRLKTLAVGRQRNHWEAQKQ
jgi:hypothetical protein